MREGWEAAAPGATRWPSLRSGVSLGRDRSGVWMTALLAFLRRRGRLGVLAVLPAVAVHCAREAPAPLTIEGLAGLLGTSARATVEPSSVAWEPSSGVLADLTIGRKALFLGCAKPGAPRDVYRAWVRVSPDGAPLSVTRIRNLTRTPLGDDSGLLVAGHKAAFATAAFGRVQAVTVLELDGIHGAHRPKGWFDRLLLSVSSAQRTGSFGGVGRTDIVFHSSPQGVKLTLTDRVLGVDVGRAGRGLVYDLALRTLRADEGGQAYTARAVPQVHPPKPLVLWAVDTVREQTGPGPIAWLENKVFGAKDTFKRTAYALTASDAAYQLKDSKAAAFPAFDQSAVQGGAGIWPPPPIPTLWDRAVPGEGVWKPSSPAFLKRLASQGTGDAQPPAYFYETFIRPDIKRPYAKLHLLAADMRQLELDMQAGYEDPEPLTGPPGGGRLPDEPQVLDRVVATFNGAFKTTHGEYGMMVRRRVLLPPMPGAASVIVTRDHRTGIGSWPATREVPDDLESFRQNLDPLVEDGVANPTGRYVWGWQIEGTSVMTERTALCVTSTGQLYYAWAEEIDGPTLGKGLHQAGCAYGIHLDMNPGHCGFVYTDIVDARSNKYHLKLANSKMSIVPDKYVRWSAKDFFYLMLRDPLPPGPAGVSWQVDPGERPPPAWFPGIYSGKLTLGGLQITLLSFASGRFEWRVRAGSLEPVLLDAPPMKLDLGAQDARRVLAAVGLGHTTSAAGHGLAFDGQASLPSRPGYATLVAEPGRSLQILAPGETGELGSRTEAVQLPVLAEADRLTDEAHDPGALRHRGALCVLPNGRVFVALARHDSSGPLATALLRAGCRRVVALDRGSHHPAFVHRTGTETPPIADYETSVLYALAASMTPSAFRWRVEGSAPSTHPTGYDVSLSKPAAVADADFGTHQ